MKSTTDGGAGRPSSWVPFRTLMIPLTDTEADVYIDRDHVYDSRNAYSVAVEVNVWTRWDETVSGSVSTFMIIIEGANENRELSFTQTSTATFNVKPTGTGPYVVSKTLTNDSMRYLRMKFTGATVTASTASAMIGYDVTATTFART